MAFEIFGVPVEQKFRKAGRPTEQSLIHREDGQSFVPPFRDDDATEIITNSENANNPGVMAGGVGISAYSAEAAFNTKKQRIMKYRRMSQHPEVDEAIDNIVNDALTFDGIKKPIMLNMDALDIPDSLKKKIEEEFEYCLNLINFSKMGYDIFRDWYVDGMMQYHMVPHKNVKDGIKELRPIDPTQIKKIREIVREKDSTGVTITKAVKEYFVYKNPYVTEGTYEAIRVHPDSVITVTSGRLSPNRKHSIGFLHKAIKPLNDLVSIENAAVIYRLARAPERRAFYIDIGNMQKAKGEAYVASMMKRFKKTISYDPVTGEVDNNKRHMAMLEDFWLPRRGDKGTQIDTLPGAQNLGEMEDVIYFQRKLYRSLNVPISRLEAESAMPIGRASEITRDELKFSKFIDRMRTRFCDLFRQFLRVQLILKGYVKEEEWDEFKNLIKFDFVQDFLITEQKEGEILQTRMNMLRDASEYEGRYFTRNFIMKHILRMTDDEIKDTLKGIEKEIADGVYPDPNEQDEVGF